MKLQAQIENVFGMSDATLIHLNTPTNDVVEVKAAGGRFALKLYNVQSRGLANVQWELELINHLLRNGVPVVKPVKGRHGYAEVLTVDGQERAAALFEWAAGEKPEPGRDTYALLGKVAGQIHLAADTFHSTLFRKDYRAEVLIDEQLERMKAHLVAAGRWEQMTALGTRLKRILTDPALDRGICHMDLTLDNVHRQGDALTVFDFDSAGTCWRALEPYKVLKLSRDYFEAWLEGYRAVRPFSQVDEQAVAAFGVIGDLRVVAWDLGVARSSRGEPKLKAEDFVGVVDAWLTWAAGNKITAL